MHSSSKELTGYPSIDKPWLKYYTKEDLEIQIPRCTIYKNIYDNNCNYPDDIAINYFGNKISYGKLFQMVDVCAKSLLEVGIKKGDCVTLCTAGVPEAIYVVLACSRIGAIANFINPLFAKEQMIDRINETEAKWIFILDEMYSYIEKALPNTCIENIVIIPVTNAVSTIPAKVLYLKSKARKIMKSKDENKQKHILWNKFLSIGKVFNGKVDIEYEEGMPTVMVYSSGTTGASKGILLTNDGINATIANYQTSGFPYRRGDSFLQMIPIWFSTGIVLSILMPLVQGIKVIPEPLFSKETFANDLIKYKPNMTLAATSLWLYVIRSNETRDLNLSNMKYPITGGEKVLPQDEKNMLNYLKYHGCKSKMIKGYGMCELGSTVSTSNAADNYYEKGGGTGYPILNVVVSAFDLNTDKELKYGEHGEIRVCSPARMKGYYKNPQATAEFFKTDDKGNVWGCTGDIGYVDEDGEVFVLGRATDHFCRENGEVVYLFDIEEEIFKNEMVNQCKVVDIDENGETRLAAHIVLRSGDVDNVQLLNIIHKMLLEALPEYMVPDYYKIRKSMPVHANGKRDVEAIRGDREDLITL